MSILNSIIAFCAIQPGMSHMPETEYKARLNDCKKFVMFCISEHESGEKTGWCMDQYNRLYYPNRECKNNMKGKCS